MNSVADEIGEAGAAELIAQLAGVYKADYAAARRRLIEFCRKVYRSPPEGLDEQRRADCDRNIRAGNVWLGQEPFDPPAPVPPAPVPPVPNTQPERNDAVNKRLVEMDEDELDAKFAKLKTDSQTSMARADEALAAVGKRKGRKEDGPSPAATEDLHVSRAKRNGQVAPATSPPASPPPQGEEHPYAVQQISIDLIAPTALNPRHYFDEGKLEELAETMRQRGVDNPLWVRPQPGMKEQHGRFELIAGERRLKAAKLAGLKEVPCRIYRVSDQVAADLCFSENHDRADLNPIDEARSIDMMIRVGGYTQEQMSKRLGIEQGTIANKLGVLKLPRAWQDRIISGEITPTHARALPKWADYPQVLAEIDKRVKERMRNGYGGNKYFPNATEFTDIVNESALHIGRPISGEYAIRTDAGVTPSGKVLFKPTPEQLVELRVEKVKHWNGDRQFAFNVELWEQLQAQGKKAEKKKQQAKLDKAGTPAKKAGPSPRDARAKEDARRKAENEERERDQARGTWLCNWLKSRMLDRFDQIRPGHLRILTCTQACPNNDHEFFARCIVAASGRVVKRSDGYFRDVHVLESYASIDPTKVDVNLDAFDEMAVRLWLEEEERGHFDLRNIAIAAAMVGVDAAAEWTPSQECLEFFTLDELKAIAKEWKFHPGVVSGAVGGAKDRAQLIEVLLIPAKPGSPRPMPSILSSMLPAADGKKKKKGGKR